MKTQRIIGIALFLVGLTLGLMSDLFASDPQVQTWYTAYRTWILAAGGVLVVVGIILTFVNIPGRTPRTTQGDPTASPHSSQPSSAGTSHEDEEFLRNQLSRHRQNLQRLLEQKSIYAKGDEPLHLLNQIEAEEQALKEIGDKLQR